MQKSETEGRKKRPGRHWNEFSIAIIAVVFIVALAVFQPAMPDRIVLLTGPEDSTYHHLGTRYAEQLRKDGLEVEVVETAGAFDNLQRLAGGEVAVAFAPSIGERFEDTGIESADLVALASVGLQPLWLFHRSDAKIERITDLKGRRVAAGGTGSVSDYLARALFGLNGIDGSVEIRSIAGQEPDVLVDEIVSSAVDAIFLTGGTGTPTVKALLDADDVTIMSFDRAQAYATKDPGVTDLLAPEGIFDMARNFPPEDTHLLSATSCLVAHEDLNATVVRMILRAAESVSERAEEFVTPLRFPSSENVSLPLDATARRYFDQGKKGLGKRIPYSVIRYLNHLGSFVLPLLILVVVLLKVLPMVIKFWFKFQMQRRMIQLGDVEKRYAAGDDRSDLLGELSRIDRATAKLFVPRAGAHDYVDFRQFLHDMRERVEGSGPG